MSGGHISLAQCAERVGHATVLLASVGHAALRASVGHAALHASVRHAAVLLARVHTGGSSGTKARASSRTGWVPPALMV